MGNAHINLGNRYPGGRPFTPEENALYFGREKDINNLIDLVSIKQTIVLFGKSGYGKSSLINAGIIPNLQKREEINYVPFLIRFKPYSGTMGFRMHLPAETVRRTLAQSTKGSKHPDFDKITTEKESFWYWIKLHQFIDKKDFGTIDKNDDGTIEENDDRTKDKKDIGIRYVLLFDQFEELFTYPKEHIRIFSERLSQLLYEPVPLEFLVKFKQVKEEQIKEGHTFDPEFLQLLYQKPEVSVVFAIRSDRMAQMNVLADRHPSILKTCYELNALSAEEAKSAIVKPAKLAGDFKKPAFNYEESAKDVMLEHVKNTQDGKIEAATLQILCRYIEDNLVKDKNLVKDENQTISKVDLGDITDVFRRYYENILDKLDDDKRQSAVRLLEKEMVDGERRNMFTQEYIVRHFAVPEKLLDELEQSSLIKKERDSNRGIYLYEISHDTIVAAVNRVAEERRKEEEIAEEKDKEAKAEEERKKLQLRLEKEQKARRKLRVLTIVIFILLIIATIASVKWRHLLNVEKAIQKQKDEALIKVKKLRKENALSEAALQMGFGDTYANSHYYVSALTTYQSALDLIKQYPHETTYARLEQKIIGLEKTINQIKNLNPQK